MTILDVIMQLSVIFAIVSVSIVVLLVVLTVVMGALREIEEERKAKAVHDRTPDAKDVMRRLQIKLGK